MPVKMGGPSMKMGGFGPPGMMKNPDLDSNNSGGMVNSKESIKDQIKIAAVNIEKDADRTMKTGGFGMMPPAPGPDDPPPSNVEV